MESEGASRRTNTTGTTDNGSSISRPDPRFGSPLSSSFYEEYVRNPRYDEEWFQKEFRREYGMPWWNYLEMVEEVKAEPSFRPWLQPDVRAVAPVEVLVLAALRIIRGSCAYSLYVYMCVSVHDINKFTRSFLDFMSSTIFDVYVRPTLKPKKKVNVDDNDDVEDLEYCVEKVMKHFAGTYFHEVK